MDFCGNILEIIMKYNLIGLLLMTGISCHVAAGDVKKSIYTTKAPAPIGTYSQGIQFGNIIYISGQIPIDPKTGELVKGSFKNQTRQVFENISEIAKASGSSLNDILKLTIYVTSTTVVI
jgi:enamine deaminase RidA (YjgF/YER057c/UK114 family)